MIAPKNSPFILLFCLALSACVNASDPDVAAYLEHKPHLTDKNYFSHLPDASKTEVFFGAMKVHPPATSIEACIAKEDVAFLHKLKAEIEKRGGSIEAYSFINAVALKFKNGGITRNQVDSMRLAEFCKNQRDDYNLCSNILESSQLGR